MTVAHKIPEIIVNKITLMAWGLNPHPIAKMIKDRVKVIDKLEDRVEKTGNNLVFGLVEENDAMLAHYDLAKRIREYNRACLKYTNGGLRGDFVETIDPCIDPIFESPFIRNPIRVYEQFVYLDRDDKIDGYEYVYDFMEDNRNVVPEYI